MREMKIKNPNRNGYFAMLEAGDYQYCHPLEKLGELIMTATFSFTLNTLLFARENNRLPSEEGIRNPLVILEMIARKAAIQTWEEELAKITNQPLPENLMDILNATKKQQLKILKGLTLTSDELFAFYARAWDHGYTLSNYTFELSQKGLDVKQMPVFALKEDDGSITAIGNTTLSRGQIKNAIDHRSVRIAKFLDNGDRWHCFFHTYKSMSGEEGYKGGAHLHFISHTWGGSITREEVLRQLSVRDYKLSAYHISYYRRRSNQNPADNQV